MSVKAKRTVWMCSSLICALLGSVSPPGCNGSLSTRSRASIIDPNILNNKADMASYFHRPFGNIFFLLMSTFSSYICLFLLPQGGFYSHCVSYYGSKMPNQATTLQWIIPVSPILQTQDFRLLSLSVAPKLMIIVYEQPLSSISLPYTKFEIGKTTASIQKTVYYASIYRSTPNLRLGKHLLSCFCGIKGFFRWKDLFNYVVFLFF